MAKRVLITGAAGFIGFHLARHLQARGDDVVGFDNFNDYYNPQLKWRRAALLKELGVKIIEGDICESHHLRAATESQAATHFVHLAAQAGVRYSLSHPQAYIKANIEGFLNVLEICRSMPEIKLTYASSSSVYGLNQKVPFAVDDHTDCQASLYGVTKKSNELMASTYHHLYGLAVTGLRFFTVYGPWGRPDMAYFSFTEAIATGRPIDLYNYGRMQRDFTYIDDIIAGTVAAIDLGAPLRLYNLGNHQPMPLMEMVTILEKRLGCTAKIQAKPMQPGDVPVTYADIEASRQELQFQPKTSLQEGLNAFVDWYLEYKETLLHN